MPFSKVNGFLEGASVRSFIPSGISAAKNTYTLPARRLFRFRQITITDYEKTHNVQNFNRFSADND